MRKIGNLVVANVQIVQASQRTDLRRQSGEFVVAQQDLAQGYQVAELRGQQLHGEQVVSQIKQNQVSQLANGVRQSFQLVTEQI